MNFRQNVKIKGKLYSNLGLMSFGRASFLSQLLKEIEGSHKAERLDIQTIKTT